MGILISQSEEKRNSLDQSEERRDFKMRDFKNAKVILLRDLRNLSGGAVCTVIQYKTFKLFLCQKKSFVLFTYSLGERDQGLFCFYVTTQLLSFLFLFKHISYFATSRLLMSNRNVWWLSANNYCPVGERNFSGNMKKEEPEELSDAWMLNWTNEEDIKPLDVKQEITDKHTSSYKSDKQDNEADIKWQKSDSLTTDKSTKKLLSTYPCQLKELRVRLKKIDNHNMGHKNYFKKMEKEASKNIKEGPTYQYGKRDGIDNLDLKAMTCNTKRPTKFDKYMAELCQRASVVSSTENQVVYKCPDCKTLLYSYFTLYTHIKSTGHFKRNTSMFQLKGFIEKLVCHECKICHEKLLCDGHFIRRHVMRNHNVTRLDYIRRFSVGKEKIIMTLINNAPLSNVIDNQCQYTCPVCKKNYICYQNINQHFRSTNHRKSSMPSKKFLTKVVLHQCHLCSHKMLCERTFIAKHLKSVHKVSLEKYVNDTGFKQAGFIMGKTRKFLEVHALTAPVSKTVTNMCQYACNTCSYTNSSWSTFKNHLLRTCHGPCQVIKYLTKTVLHQCHLCDKTLLCDKHHIQKHITRDHQMQMQDYSAKADAISREHDYE